MLHSLFEVAIKNKDFSDASLNESTEEVVVKYIEQLYSFNIFNVLTLCRYALGLTDEDARKHMHNYFPVIRDWSRKFLKSFPSREVNRIYVIYLTSSSHLSSLTILRLKMKYVSRKY